MPGIVDSTLFVKVPPIKQIDIGECLHRLTGSALEVHLAIWCERLPYFMRVGGTSLSGPPAHLYICQDCRPLLRGRFLASRQEKPGDPPLFREIPFRGKKWRGEKKTRDKKTISASPTESTDLSSYFEEIGLGTEERMVEVAAPP